MASGWPLFVLDHAAHEWVPVARDAHIARYRSLRAALLPSDVHIEQYVPALSVRRQPHPGLNQSVILERATRERARSQRQPAPLIIGVSGPSQSSVPVPLQKRSSLIVEHAPEQGIGF